MFEVLDLSSRAIAQLKDICKQFGIDAKGLTKSDMVLKIVDAQASNQELAATVVNQFPKKETATNQVNKDAASTEVKVKKPRIQKPIEGTVKVEKTLFKNSTNEKVADLKLVDNKPSEEKQIEVKPVSEKVSPSNQPNREERPKFEKRE
jgi:hypothetical protein